MSTSEATGQPAQTNPLRHLLNPIRLPLAVAATLAAAGSMLALAPLAGIATIASTLLGGMEGGPVAVEQARASIWQVAIGSVISLFAGMALLSMGELLAHLADNRITHHLRLAAVQRLAQAPLGWFSSRASGAIKQAMQDDIATLHSLTAHFYTAVGRATGAVLISVMYLFMLDWRLALIALLPFPGFFLFLRHAMQVGSAHMPEFVARLGHLNGATVEFVNGIPVVKAFGAAGKAHSGYRQAVDRFADAFVDFTRTLVTPMAHAHAMIAPVTVLGLVL